MLFSVFGLFDAFGGCDGCAETNLLVHDSYVMLIVCSERMIIHLWQCLPPKPILAITSQRFAFRFLINDVFNGISFLCEHDSTDDSSDHFEANIGFS